MDANSKYQQGRELTYVDFPTKFVWETKQKEWRPRKSGVKIGRVYYALPTSGERYYLRMLLNIVKGPRTYNELKKVGEITYNTFKEACKARGLLDDDNEWFEAIEEASHWGRGYKLRHMFVSMLLFNEVTEPLELWEKTWKWLSDDILYYQRRLLKNAELQLTEEQIKNYTLYEIEKVLNHCGKSLNDYPPLPYPDMSFLPKVQNRLISDELSYNTVDLHNESSRLQSGLNTKQREIFDIVTNAVESKNGGVFFVYGCGGTGKTYLYMTIISKLRSEGKIVLAVASSGIASLLLPGGRTAHSRFRIQIPVNEDSCCDITQRSNLAELIRQADLIVWDEAPMNHRHNFEAVDRTLKDLMRFKIVDSDKRDFGGKTFLLGGDFRQILPVIPRGSREDIVDASVNRSIVWKNCQVFVLTENMRLQNGSLNQEEAKSIKEFSKWVLALGDGNLPAISINEDEEPVWIKIPDDLLIPQTEDCIAEIASTIYPNLTENNSSTNYLKERSILSPTNESVDEINSYIISSLPGNSHTYYSSDSIGKLTNVSDEQSLLWGPEFLNSLKFSGLPNNELELKVGVPIMLLRNMNQSKGQCNGTRLIVTRLGNKVIEAVIITGTNIGDKVYIPRIIMEPNDTKWPFTFRRKQFPVKVCFAMTINKSQGQTFDHVGIYLPKPIFSHGQLYVAVSRTTSRDGLKVLIKKNNSNEPDGYTQNIVYKEIFNNLPRYW